MSNRSEFVTTVMSELIKEFDDAQLDVIEKTLNTCLADFEVDRRNTEIAPYESFVPNYYPIFIARKKLAGRAIGTLKLYNYYLMDFFLNKPAPIEEMDSVLMLRYLYDFQKRKGVGNNTLDKVRIMISTFFEWAQREGYVARNFVGNIDPIKFTEKPRTPLNTEEIVMLRDACETYRERALVDLFLSTGIRLDEMMKLKWSDINLDTKSMLVLGKGSKYRTVLFNSEAKVSLLKYRLVRPGQSEYVFVSEKYPYKEIKHTAIENIIKRVSSRSGIAKKVSPHVLRHTFATMALAKGMPLEQLQKLLGHEKISTTLIYAKVELSQVEEEYKRCFA